MQFQDIKSAVRAVLPAPVHKAWARLRFELEQRSVRGKPLEDVFSEIYEKRMWGSAESGAPYCSGPGSEAALTEGYEKFVTDFVVANGVTRITDVGCGDFQVGGRIMARLAERGQSVTYTGCDIAANVVAYNRRHHTREGVSFEVLDVSRQLPPPADVVLVREVLQHLSNDHVKAALNNIKRAAPFAIVTEALPAKMLAPNLDIASGYRTRDGLGSGLLLELPPFNQMVVGEFVVPVSEAECFRTVVVEL